MVQECGCYGVKEVFEIITWYHDGVSVSVFVPHVQQAARRRRGVAVGQVVVPAWIRVVAVSSHALNGRSGRRVTSCHLRRFG